MQVNRARCCYRNRGHSYFDGHSVRSGDGGGPADSWCKGPLHLLPRPPCEVYRSTDGCPHHLATGIIWKIIHSFTNIQLDPYYMAKGMVQFIHSQTNKRNVGCRYNLVQVIHLLLHVFIHHWTSYSVLLINAIVLFRSSL